MVAEGGGVPGGVTPSAPDSDGLTRTDGLTRADTAQADDTAGMTGARFFLDLPVAA